MNLLNSTENESDELFLKSISELETFWVSGSHSSEVFSSEFQNFLEFHLNESAVINDSTGIGKILDIDCENVFEHKN